MIQNNSPELMPGNCTLDVAMLSAFHFKLKFLESFAEFRLFVSAADDSTHIRDIYSISSNFTTDSNDSRIDVIKILKMHYSIDTRLRVQQLKCRSVIMS